MVSLSILDSRAESVLSLWKVWREFAMDAWVIFVSCSLILGVVERLHCLVEHPLDHASGLG